MQLNAKAWSEVTDSLAGGGVMTTKHWTARTKWAELRQDE